MKERLVQQTSADALLPADIAARLEGASVKRAELPAGSLVVLAVLGGIYIGLLMLTTPLSQAAPTKKRYKANAEIGRDAKKKATRHDS